MESATVSHAVVRRVAAASLAAFLVPWAVLPAAAATGSTIHVTSLDPAAQLDTQCNLAEAIDSANNDNGGGECINGSGADKIVFDVSGTVTYAGELPAIGSDLTIDGSGVVLDAAGHTGFYATSGTVRFVNVQIQNARNGIYGQSGLFSLVRSTIRNTSGASASAIGVSGGTLTIVSSTITGSTGADSEASRGVDASGGSVVTISNSTIADNEWGITEGDFSTMTVINSTITDAGPLAYFVATGSRLVVRNSILIGGADLGGVLDDDGTNLFAADRTGILASGAPAAHGGPTPTIPLLSTATGAIDKGNPDFCPVVDQRGATRSTTCDLGAYERDTVKPTVTAPTPSIRTSATLSGSSLPVRIKWTASGTGSGIDHAVLQRSTDGGSWTTVSSSITGSSRDVTLAKGHSYRFRVQVFDWDNNASSVVSGPSFTTVLTQDTSSAITYSGTWSSQSSSLFSGGATRYSKSSGASAKLAFSGRSVGFVTTLLGDRGQAKIYIDGTLVTTVNLLSGGPTYRAIAYQKSWSSSGSHTIKVVVVGTAGNPRVDVDAFAVLK